MDHKPDVKIPEDVGGKYEKEGVHSENAYPGLDDWRRTIAYLERLLKFDTEKGDKAGEGSTYGNLGNAYYSLGDFKRAIDYHERHLDIAKEVGDKAGEGCAYGNLGNVYYSLGDFKRAIDYHERHLNIVKEVGDKAGEGRAYCSLGNAYYKLAAFERAIDYQERHLNVAKELGDKAGEGGAYGNLGIAYRSLGDFKRAIDYHERHLNIAKEVGDKAGEGGAYGNLGDAYTYLGDFKRAIDCHQRHLNIAKEVGDKAGEGRAYGNLGNAYRGLGDFKRAIDCHERHLNIAKEVGDKAGEGGTYGNLGNAYYCLGDFKRAIDYHERQLNIAKEVGDKSGEGSGYGNLGTAYFSLGDFRTAIDFHQRCLNIVKEVGDKAREGSTYGNLGNAYYSLGKYETAVDCHERHLNIAKEVGDKAGEGGAHGSLGIDYHMLGDFERAIEHHERHLNIAQEVGDKAGEGRACGNLGNAYYSLRDFERAIDYQERYLNTAKQLGDKAGEVILWSNLGRMYESQGSLFKALDCYHFSVNISNDIRRNIKFRDDLKISYRNMRNNAYSGLWRLYLKKGEVAKALRFAEEGRAQALRDLMYLKYRCEEDYILSSSETSELTNDDSLSCLSSDTVFIAIAEQEIIFWVIQNGKDVQLRRKEISDYAVQGGMVTFVQSLIHNVREEVSTRASMKCENRSLDEYSDGRLSNERSNETDSQSVQVQGTILRKLHDFLIAPIADLIDKNELIFVPEGPLCLVPYAALLDTNLKYLCESFRVRVIPSLSTLKLIADSPADYHSKTSALLVGDPCLKEVKRRLKQLPCAREEVEMIGLILNTAPLTGEEATKDEVLKRLSSVALIHIAAHGRMETGEIFLAPSPTRRTRRAKEKDCFLTMADVLHAKLRARLVVLSCCHSAQGEIKAEGVVGVARAFLGAGARSVLVSLWAIDDEATLEFMKRFYQELARGRSASDALNRAMNCMKESEKFKKVRLWAPFVLIGDDVTLEFDEIKNEQCK